MFYKNRKSKFWLISVALLSLLVFLAGCGSGGNSSGGSGTQTSGTPSQSGGTQTSAQPDKVYELDLNDWFPSTHHYGQKVYEPWAKYVGEQTNGRIKVNTYYSATLGGSATALDDIAGGAYDITGFVISSYFYDTPMFKMTMIDLPYAFPEPVSASKVLGKLTEKYAMDAVSGNGLVFVGPVTSDPYVFWSTTPIKTVDDLKGKKVRIPGPAFQDVIKEWGAVPVSVSTEEVYDALDKGTLDVTIYPIITGEGLKIQEVAPHITEVGLFTLSGATLLNEEFYNSLPEDLQKQFMEELGPKLAEDFTKVHVTAKEEALEKIKQEIQGKGEYYIPTQAELETFYPSGKVAWDSWVEEAKKRGYPAEDMMNDFKQWMKEEGINPPF